MKTSSLASAACALALAGTFAGAAEASQSTERTALDSVRRYCVSSWRQARIARQDWDDCTQQVLADLLQRVRRDGIPRAMNEPTSHERQELKRAVWAAAQRWRRQRRSAPLYSHDVESPERGVARQEAQELIDASDSLSARQRFILHRSLDGATARELAEELGVPAARVSDEKYKAIQKLRRELEPVWA